jgi:hypothetical protein
MFVYPVLLISCDNVGQRIIVSLSKSFLMVNVRELTDFAETYRVGNVTTSHCLAKRMH